MTDSVTNNNPQLVSVCMPIYNRPELLKRALDHLLAQSHENIEIIVSDDCSPNEEVKEVLLAYAARDARIKPFFQPENLGELKNQEFVIGRASSEYIMIHSEDDYLEKNYIKACYDFLASHPDYAMATTTCIVEPQRQRAAERGFTHPEAGEYPIADPALLEVDSPRARHNSLLMKIQNYFLYSGLLRKSVYKSIYKNNFLDFDRYYLAGIAYAGKIATITDWPDSAFHRGGINVENDVYVERLRLSWYDKIFPYLRQIYYSYMDILFFGRIYKDMGLIKRFIFANKVFLLNVYVWLCRCR